MTQIASSRTPFSDLVGRSLEVIERECPIAFIEIGRLLERQSARFEVDGQSFVLGFASGRPRLVNTPTGGPTDVRVLTRRSTLADLVNGRVRLLHALEEDRLSIFGEPAALGRFFEALDTYLRGAARSPGFDSLLTELNSASPMVESGLTPDGWTRVLRMAEHRKEQPWEK